MVRFKKICEILPSSTKLSGFNTPKKNRLLQLQKCLSEAFGTQKNPTIRPNPWKSLVRQRWPFFPDIRNSLLGIQETSSKGRRCHETMPTQERVRSLGEILELRPFKPSLETNKRWPVAGPIFRGRFPVKKFRNVYYGLFLFSAPVIDHLEGPKRSYITFIYNIYSEEFEWLESMEMSTKRWPAWGLCSILWNQSCKRCLVENT